MIHTYGLTGAPAPLPVGGGVDGAALRAVGVDGLTAVVSDHREQPHPTPPRLLEHERVLQALLPHGVLPARYGPALPGEDALRGLLAGRAERFRQLLERLRGRVEMGVRVDLPPAPTRQDSTGRGYLLDKLHRERLAAALADDLDLALGPLALERRVLAAREDLRIAYLVEAARVADFRRRLQAVGERLRLGGRPAGALRCTGPWPAYSFVTEDQP